MLVNPEFETLAVRGNTTLKGGASVTGAVTASGAISAGAASSIAGNLTLSNGNLILGTSGNGIDFSATANGSGTMTSELLDDYEEGTWTPVYQNDQGPFGTVTYDSNSGRYTRIGRVVTVQGQISTSEFNVGAASGVCWIGGLPFTCGFTSGSMHAGRCINFLSSDNTHPVCGTVGSGTTRIQLRKQGFTSTNATTDFVAADFALGAFAFHNFIWFTATYTV